MYNKFSVNEEFNFQKIITKPCFQKKKKKKRITFSFSLNKSPHNKDKLRLVETKSGFVVISKLINIGPLINIFV